MTKSDYVLFLPKWYPNDEDPQLGVFIRKQAKAVAELMHVVVIYVQKKDQLHEVYKVHQVQYEKWTEITVQFRESGNKIKNLKRYRNAQRRGLEAIGEIPLICHVHVPVRPVFLARHLQRKYNVPFVVSEHWSGLINGQYEKKGSLYRWMYQQVVRRAKQNIVVSTPLQNAFNRYKLPEPVVVPNIIEQQALEADKEKIILTVGDLVDQTKNISGIITAFNHWKKEHDNNYRLHIIGGGPDENWLRDKAEKSAFSEEIVFHGRLKNEAVLEWMQKASIYVCNSNFETFGVTVGEALAAGCPVICTRCQGPEQFINQDTGILIPKNDEDALLKALEKMVDNMDRYEPQNIRNTIQNEFSARTVGNRLIEIYRGVLKRE